MSGKATLKNFKTMLAEAKLPERTVMICLRGDLAADHEAAEARAGAGAEGSRSTASPASGVRRDRRAASRPSRRRCASTPTTFTAARPDPKPQWRALLAAHPPRRDDNEHHRRGPASASTSRRSTTTLVRRSVPRRPGPRRRRLGRRCSPRSPTGSSTTCRWRPGYAESGRDRRPFLARRFESEAGFRRRVETRRPARPVPPSRLDGREPVEVTELRLRPARQAGPVGHDPGAAVHRAGPSAELLALAAVPRPACARGCGRPARAVHLVPEGKGPEFAASS
jgi:hypothetical protein